jgi:hypothetical protein
MKRRSSTKDEGRWKTDNGRRTDFDDFRDIDRSAVRLTDERTIRLIYRLTDGEDDSDGHSIYNARGWVGPPRASDPYGSSKHNGFRHSPSSNPMFS